MNQLIELNPPSNQGFDGAKEKISMDRVSNLDPFVFMTNALSLVQEDEFNFN